MHRGEIVKIERKKLLKIAAFCFSFLLVVAGTFGIKNILDNRGSKLFKESGSDVAYAPYKSTIVLEYLQKEAENKIVFDGLTMDELVAKLNRFLKGKLEGTGEHFATRSLELGLDPYLAVAISLHETGCNGTCSKLVQYCNNVGGMKGSPGCAGGAYKQFDTLEEGIDAFLNNLYYNYIAKGLTTPEQINAKYAESKTWASKVNYYINKIKAG